jgi:hypothetical protein
MAIIRNSVKCKRCGDEIESTWQHDFKWCSCGDVGVDGGKDYLRHLFRTADGYVNTSIEEPDDSHSTI